MLEHHLSKGHWGYSEGGRYHAHANPIGRAQHMLLGAIPQDRRSPAVRDRLREWDAKFGGPAVERPGVETRGGLVGSLNTTDKAFIGSTTVGPVSLNTAPHSATWERCPPPPAIVESLRVTFSALAAPGPQHVVRAMAADRIFGGSGWTFGSPPAEQIESVLRSHGGSLTSALQGMQLTAHFGRGAPSKRS